MKQINSVAMIMDGNRRWAVENGMSKLGGHKYGAEKISEVIDWIKEQGIEHLTLYAFSTENWKRTKIEVETIMRLFEDFLINQIDKIIKKEVKIKFIGKLDMFSGKMQKLMKELELKSENHKTTLFMAMSYGGRLEIVEAVKKIIIEKKGQNIEKLSENEFEKYLWTEGLKDPEIVIRTGGDKRLSNFLLWKAAYSELFFTETFWPDFSKEEFLKILDEYRNETKINKGK